MSRSLAAYDRKRLPKTENPFLVDIHEPMRSDPASGWPRYRLRTNGDETLGRHPWLPGELAARLIRAYGTRAERILTEAGSLADLGTMFGADLTEREVAYLMREEWAATPDDVLWRRSKLGLRIVPEGCAALAAFMAARGGLAPECPAAGVAPAA